MMLRGRAYFQTSSHDGNITTSKVTLTPRVKDSGQLIRCQASNPLLRNSIEDLWRLKIRCKCRSAAVV